MKAVQFRVSVPRYLFGLIGGKITPAAFISPFGCVQYRDVSEPKLLGPEWVRIRTHYGGICGSDLNNIRLHDSPSLSPFGSDVFTIGHEQVGIIVEAGRNVTDLRVGQRVTADPVLPCPTRGISLPCPSCQAGEWSRCENFAEGNLSPGLIIGSCADTNGSWSPYFLAHRFQLFAIPDEVSDENAILVDAFCSALHPVMRSFPRDEDTVLIIGAGVVGICVVSTLRILESKARIITLAKYPFQGEWARRYGADEVVYIREGDYYERIAELTGATLYKPILGKRVMVGGADVVFECVGSDHSFDDAMRFTRAGGRLSVVGLLGQIKKVDLTPVWLKELNIQGNLTSCSDETYQEQRKRPYQLALEWMAKGKLDLSPLLTHTFRLNDYRQALSMAMHKGDHQMVKAAFVFD